MATETQSVTYAAQVAAQASAGDIIGDANLLSGGMKCLQAEWLVPAGTGAADTVLLVFLPASATLVPGLSSYVVGAAAGASTITLTLADATVVSTAIDVSAAGNFVLPTVVGSIVNTTRQAIVGTLSGAVTAAKTIYFNFVYTAGE